MSAYSSLVLGDGPRGYWRLGEAGYPVNDSTANGLNFASGSHGGANIGFSHASLIPSDPANGAVVFPVGWLAQGSNLAAVDVRDVFTMEAWVQLLQLVNTAGQTVYTNWYGTNCMRINTANKLELWADYYGPVVCASTVAINDLLPHHVVVTKNGSAVHLYMDGVDVTGTVTNYTFTSAPGWMGIGTDASGASGNPANMVMDEVAIYPVALSQAQVLAHYHSGTGFVATVFAPVRPIRLKTSAGWADLIQVGVPTPVVNGQWLKGSGGAAVWSPIAPTDVPGVEVTANKDQPNGYPGLDANSNIDVAGYVTGENGVWGANASVNGVGLGTYVANDPIDRFEVLAGGQMRWGDGSHDQDTYLYRKSSGLLRTDGTLDANALTVNGSPITGGGVAYTGAYNPAHTYHDGDYVVGADGITYQCVKEGTVGVTPTPWSTYPNTAYGTTLPAAPFDGQEAILVDSVTNPSYQWHFRYNAQSTSAYKWEFIGGTQAHYAFANFSNTTGGSTWVYTNLLNLPRAGDWDVAFQASVAATNATLGYWQYGIGSVGTGAPGGYHCTLPAGSEQLINLLQRVTMANAGGTLQLGHLMTAQPVAFNIPYVKYQPVRVA